MTSANAKLGIGVSPGGAAILPAVEQSDAIQGRQRTMTIDVESLYRQYGDLVLGRCRSLLGNDADATEACQEIFLRVHRYRHKFRGEASPSTFLFRVTTNHCLNVLRSRRRRREDPTDDLSYVPDTRLDPTEARNLVDRLLRGVDERTSLCVIYHHMDGMTHAETGQMLGISAAAVRKRLSKFKKAVRDNPPGWLLAEERT